MVTVRDVSVDGVVCVDTGVLGEGVGVHSQMKCRRSEELQLFVWTVSWLGRL